MLDSMINLVPKMSFCQILRPYTVINLKIELYLFLGPQLLDIVLSVEGGL